MAITHNASDHGDLVRGTSVSKNVVIVPGSQIAACIGIAWINEIIVDEYVNLVTVNGNNATFVSLSVSPSGTVEHYYITGLSAGISTVFVSWAGTDPDVTAIVGIEVMSGVDPTTPIGMTASANGFSNSPSVLVPTTDNTGFVVDSLYIATNTSVGTTVGALQTQRWFSVNIGDPPTQVDGYGSTESGSASGTTMSWSLTGIRPWALVATEFRPFIEPVVGPNNVHVRTSYDYLEVSSDKLDRNDRLPEEARMVWIGRWRH